MSEASIGRMMRGLAEETLEHSYLPRGLSPDEYHVVSSKHLSGLMKRERIKIILIVWCETQRFERNTAQGYRNQVRDTVLELYTERPQASPREILDALFFLTEFDTDRHVLKRIREDVGLVKRGTRYCFEVSEKNRGIRVAYAREKMETREAFNRHIFTDETVIQLTGNRQSIWCLKEEKNAHVKEKPKFAPKVTFWAGISWEGATRLVAIEEGTIDSEVYMEILKHGLYPFMQVTPFRMLGC